MLVQTHARNVLVKDIFGHCSLLLALTTRRAVYTVRLVPRKPIFIIPYNAQKNKVLYPYHLVRV